MLFRSGDTLFSGKSALQLENIDVLQPVLNVALVPSSASDTEKLQMLLERYAVEDPTLRSFTDQETDQLIVSGLGELHLEVSVRVPKACCPSGLSEILASQRKLPSCMLPSQMSR